MKKGWEHSKKKKEKLFNDVKNGFGSLCFTENVHVNLISNRCITNGNLYVSCQSFEIQFLSSIIFIRKKMNEKNLFQKNKGVNHSYKW